MRRPLVDPEKVCAFASRHACTLPSLCPIQLLGPIELNRSHPVGAVERRSLRRPRVRRRCRLTGGGGGHLFGGAEGVPAARPRTRVLSAPSRPLLTPAAARSALAGTSSRAAEPADGAVPMALVPGVVAAALAAAADISGPCRARSREVRAARRKRHLCVRVGHVRGRCAAGRRRCRRGLPGPRARVAHDSPRPVCRVGAGRSAVAAPPQHAEVAGRGGRSAACNGRNGRREAAEVAGTRRAVDGSVGGVWLP